MSYITQIILKYGSGNPGTVLEIGEAAYDASNNILYVGNGVGNPATAIGPADVSGLASIAYVDQSIEAAVEQREYQFITSDYELTAPEGANRRLTIKNLSTNDVSIYCLTGYSIDNRPDKTLLSMNTVELYDYDASNWYIV